VDRSAFADCTVALKQAQRGRYTYVFSRISFAGFHRSQAFSRLQHVRDHAIKKFRSIYLEVTFALGVRARDTLVIFEVKRNISQTVMRHVSGDLLTPPAGQRKHGVSQNAETELLHPFRADSRARVQRARE